MTDRDVLGQAIRLVWNWIALVIVFELGGLGLGVYHAVLSPRDYASEQTLLYRFGREYFPITPGETRREWGENVLISLDNALFTEMRLLTAHDLFASTAAIAWPNGLPGQDRDASKALTATEIAELVARKFTVSRVQGAAMVTITARDPDPSRADQLVAGQVEGYLQRRAALFDQSSASFYDQQVKQAFATLADLTKQRAAILTEFGLSEADALSNAAGPVQLTLALQPIEKQIAAANADLGLLLSEQSAAKVSDAYRKQVTPVVEVVDRMSAEGNPVGLPAWASMVLGAISGIVAALVIIFLWAAIRGAEDTRERPKRRSE